MQEKKLQILQEVFGNYYSTGSEYLFFCPKCKHHKKKLSINLDKNLFKCWVCGWSGKSIFNAIAGNGNQEQINRWSIFEGKVDFSNISDAQIEQEEIIKLPKEFVTLTSKKPDPLTIQARQYLSGRGISFEDVIWWKMGFCSKGKYANRIVVPSFDMNGMVNYFVARTIDEHERNYLNPPSKKDIIFNELYLDWTKDITIVEGVFDAVIAGNSIPLLGSTLREDSFIFKTIALNCSKVFIALDPDAKKKEQEIMMMLTSYGIDVFKINIKPFKDVGTMSREEFLNRKKNAILVDTKNDLEYFIRTLNE